MSMYIYILMTYLNGCFNYKALTNENEECWVT